MYVVSEVDDKESRNRQHTQKIKKATDEIVSMSVYFIAFNNSFEWSAPPGYSLKITSFLL